MFLRVLGVLLPASRHLLIFGVSSRLRSRGRPVSIRAASDTIARPEWKVIRCQCGCNNRSLTYTERRSTDPYRLLSAAHAIHDQLKTEIHSRVRILPTQWMISVFSEGDLINSNQPCSAFPVQVELNRGRRSMCKARPPLFPHRPMNALVSNVVPPPASHGASREGTERHEQVPTLASAC